MDSYEIVDELIDKIVLNFDYDQSIAYIVRKLTGMYGKQLKVNDDGVTCENKGILTKVSIDEKNGFIAMSEEGKSTKLEDHYFVNSITYSMKNGTGSLERSNVDYDVCDIDGGSAITNEDILIIYKKFEADKCTISSIRNKTVKRYLVDDELNTESKFFQDTKYNLASGDTVQLVCKDNDIKYYYIDNSENKNNTYNGDTDTYKKNRINQQEFNRLISYGNDIYQILNDKVITRFRKKF